MTIKEKLQEVAYILNTRGDGYTEGLKKAVAEHGTVIVNNQYCERYFPKAVTLNKLDFHDPRKHQGPVYLEREVIQELIGECLHAFSEYEDKIKDLEILISANHTTQTVLTLTDSLKKAEEKNTLLESDLAQYDNGELKIKACLDCGQCNPTYDYDSLHRFPGYFIRCGFCKNEGPRGNESIKDAIRKWNVMNTQHLVYPINQKQKESKNNATYR